MRRSLVGRCGDDPVRQARKAESYDVTAPSAVRAALADAGITLDQVQQAYAGYVYGDWLSLAVAAVASARAALDWRSSAGRCSAEMP